MCVIQTREEYFYLIRMLSFFNITQDQRFCRKMMVLAFEEIALFCRMYKKSLLIPH
jgi:hypothetical protein